MKLTFYGAAQSITGSKHLIETEGFRILLDCGMHQGGLDHDLANRSLPFDPKTIDCVILSHAHADHCGLLPSLVAGGFRGKIYCTSATADIAKYILEDSAMVQQADERYAYEHGLNAYPVIYTRKQAEDVFRHFAPVSYFRLNPVWTQINDRIRFKFYDAGHILGSATTVLEIRDGGTVSTLAYTGDLGSPNRPILNDPERIAESCGTLICEATYGSKLHRPLNDAIAQMKEVVISAVRTRGKIIVPAFALGRTQEIIYTMHKLTDEGSIPRIPIYTDSPLAQNISEVFLRHLEDFDANSRKDFTKKNELPLIFRNLIPITSVAESKALNTRPGPFMVIASSGMMEGGRILHHLKNNLSDSKNTLLITGYQAAHTLGRRLQEGAKSVRIFGKPVPVAARIITMDEFSAHGDQAYLSSYIRSMAGLQKLFLVHTELPAAESLKQVLMQSSSHLEINIPKPLQSFDITPKS
ncbi:MAG TPA: MBL fold metallo-hydrolase [Patescibacteria group bacterium]|nr:MBL fold metallo-hydrolase [Patescibacteria group bacterium]